MKFKIILRILFDFLFNLIIIKSSELSEIGAHLILNLKEANNEKESLSESNYMWERMYHTYYSKFNIGKPIQRLKFFYETNIYGIIVTEDEYDKVRSTTYKLIDQRFKNLLYKDNSFIINDSSGYLSEEKFGINQNIIIDNFTFLLKGKNTSENEKNVNIIGLSLNKNKSQDDSLSFLGQLKQKNYIDKKIYSFLFEDDMIRGKRGIDCQILIGCLPHEINAEFEEKDLKWISLDEKNYLKRNWHLKFDIVKYNNDELKEKTADFDFNLNLIIGPESFRQKLLIEFFKDKIENKKCFENYFYNLKDEQFYIFYSCSMEAEFIEIPNLSFYNKELNETFNLSFADLFTTYRHRFYFNIIFNKTPQDNWVFGHLFFKSYRFVFDLEKERIGYYKIYQNEERPMIIIFFIFIVLISIFFAYLFYKNKYENYNIIYQNEISYPIRKEYADDINNNQKDKNKNIVHEKEKQN